MEISSQSVLSQLLSSRELCSFSVSKVVKPQIPKQSFQSGDRDLSVAPHPLHLVFPFLQVFYQENSTIPESLALSLSHGGKTQFARN